MEATEPSNERLGFGKMGYGCQHYRRRCMIRAPCCNEIYSCRHCHNEAASMLRNISDRHELNRFDVKQVVCSVCDTEQPVHQVCTNCGVNMGEYFCEICKFYDDDIEKGQFHCVDCGICRVGGCENYFHCKKCGSCYAIYLRDNHLCVENSMQHHCPICYEYLFDSMKETTVMKCGHTMHCECRNEMIKREKYCCPICSKTVIDMSQVWKRKDEEIEATVMPDDYRHKKVWIRCNDLSYSPEILQSLIVASPPPRRQWHCLSSFSSRYPLSFSEIGREKYLPMLQNVMTTSKAYLSTEAATPAESNPSDVVKELYDKIIESVNVKRTMSPNAWLWSLINNCHSLDDIKLLFDALQNLRRFRMSNLRIHDNFNSHLCREIVKASIRAGAIDFGKKALWNHNVYGLTPTIGSANHLLSHAEHQKDAKLLIEVMKLMKRNGLTLQPSTADVVFSICYNLDNWELMLKYSKRFIKEGVKLRKSAFGLWMDFAAKRGDTKSLWKIEKLRSESIKKHSILSGFACAKGLILERKPEDAASVIQALNQTLPGTKKSGIVDELQKLISQWPLGVVNYHQGENRKALIVALKSDIPTMVASLLNLGLEAKVNLEDLTQKDIPC